MESVHDSPSRDSAADRVAPDGKDARLLTGRLAQADSAAESRFPDIGDLVDRLRFSFNEGRIWLDTQRVALLHLSTIGALRRELIDTLGMSKARGLLTRMGYESGARDAVLARKLRPRHSFRDAFLVGPQLRNLQGVAAPLPVRIEADIAKGRYYGEFLWPESFEVDLHIAAYGMADRPVCWMQLGYFCGYTSAFMGRNILYREVECRATGSSRCRVIGKPIEEWDDIGEELRALQPEEFVNRFEEHRPLAPAVVAPRRGKDLSGMPVDLVGVSTNFVAACHMLRKVAHTDATVLFLGETGVGKEMFARTLHQIGRRAGKPFVAVNCAAIPENLIEAELFGVVKGAFTGADSSRPGRFERADRGTLFLDEIGTLTQAAQIKLLRAIQEREIERVGDTVTRRVDVRIVAATNMDLRLAVREKKFRPDLLYRLDVYPIRLPPLRERRDDIPLLMDHFLRRYTRMHGRRISGFTRRALDALYDYNYPGNIRELENLVERAVILAEDDQPIDLSHLFASEDLLAPIMHKLTRQGALGRQCGAGVREAPGANGDANGMEALDVLLDNGVGLASIEAHLMRQAVEKAGGNLARAARKLGLTRPQLVYRLNKIDKP